MFDEVADMLRRILGDGCAEITPTTRLEEHLTMESVDLLSLSELLRQRYGDTVDLAGHVRSLDIDAIIALSVDDVVTYVRGVT